ncbi:MAG: Sec-independent protein translocase TatB, partial [Mycobacterium sp.]
YLSGVTTQLREDIGPEFDDLRGPLSELQKLRGMTPRAALTKHLLDGDDSIFTGNFDRPVNGTATSTQPADPAPGSPGANGGSNGSQQHAPGHTPFDTDAT